MDGIQTYSKTLLPFHPTLIYSSCLASSIFQPVSLYPIIPPFLFFSLFFWYFLQIENTIQEAVEVSLMFSFQNGDGGPGDSAGGHVNHSFERNTVKGHPEVDMFTAQTEATANASGGGGSGGGGGSRLKARVDGASGDDSRSCRIKGVEMKHCRRTTVVFDPKNEPTLRRQRTGGSGGSGLCQGPGAACIADGNDNFRPLPPAHPYEGRDSEFEGGEGSEGGEGLRRSTIDGSVPPQMGEVMTDYLTFGIAALDIPGYKDLTLFLLLLLHPSYLLIYSLTCPSLSFIYIYTYLQPSYLQIK